MPTTHIQDIENIINYEFPLNWINELDWNSDESSLESLMVGTTKIEKFEENCFITFARSLLSGEYIYKSEFVKTLEELRSRILRETPPIETENEAKDRLISRFSSTGKFLQNNIKRYHQMVINLDNKYENIYSRYFINAFRQEEIEEAQCNFIELYQMLFSLIKTDHYMQYDIDKIKELLIIHIELSEKLKEKETLSPDLYTVLNILDNKCLFLM